MNKVSPKIILLLALFAISNIWLGANSIPKEIITCFKTGNSNSLASYFNNNIELQVLEDENVYSKTQAEQIIKKFFSQNKPVDFTILHQSGKDGSEYAIGTLQTTTGKYRVYFLVKAQGEKQYIHQLSIKKENG